MAEIKLLNAVELAIRRVVKRQTSRHPWDMAMAKMLDELADALAAIETEVKGKDD